MPGRKPAVSPTQIKNKLKEFDIYNSNGILRNREDDVWKIICKDLENKIKPLNLFKQVEQNRHRRRSEYNEAKGIVTVDIKNDLPQETYDYEDFSLSDIEENECETKKIVFKNPNKKNRLVFEFSLTNDQWKNICPTQKICKDGRLVERLKGGWADTIRKAIWNESKLPCAFSFKRHFVGNAKFFLKITGNCTDCQSTIHVILEDKPVKADVVQFKVITTDTKQLPHNKKVRLQKLAKAEIEKELLLKKSKEWRREAVRSSMEYGDPEPPHLYKLTQLQNARQDAMNKDLGIKRRSKLFDSLCTIKNNVEFNRYLKDIGFDPFFVMYWSPEQTDVYNDIAQLLNNTVSLDATASITLKVNRVDSDSSDIFLSVMCTHIDELIVPITQALSEKNGTCFYQNWLEKCIQSGGKIPNEFVSDKGKAIQNGACLAFNSITFRVMKDMCLLVLFGETMIIKIHTKMRTDIAHTLHAVSSWPCFTKDNRTVKQLYVKIIGYMTTIDKLEIFETVLKYVFTVALSKYYDKTCQKAMENLLNLIETFKFDMDISSKITLTELLENQEIPDNAENKKTKQHTLTHTYISIIRNDVNSTLNNNSRTEIGIQSNDYYLPDFADRLQELSDDFVCWTNVMLSYFNNPRKVPVSARSEAYFGDLKSSLKNSTLRADKFLVKHMKDIDADMKLARAVIKNLVKVSEKTIDTESNEDNFYIEHLMVVERWKNKYSNVIENDNNNETLTTTPVSSEKLNMHKKDQVKSPINNSVSSHEEHNYAKFKNNVKQESSLLDDEKDRGVHVRPTSDIRLRLQQKPSSGVRQKKKYSQWQQTISKKNEKRKNNIHKYMWI